MLITQSRFWDLRCRNDRAVDVAAEAVAVVGVADAPHLRLPVSEILMRAGAHLVAGGCIEAPFPSAIGREINSANIGIDVAPGSPSHLPIQEFDVANRPGRVEHAPAPCGASI